MSERPDATLDGAGEQDTAVRRAMRFAPADAARAPVQLLVVTVTLLVLGVTVVGDLVQSRTVIVLALLSVLLGTVLVAHGFADVEGRTSRWARGAVVVPLLTVPLPAAIAAGIELPVGEHAAMFALLVVWAWFVLPSWLHVPVSVAAGVGFLAAMAWDGQTSGATSLTHAAGVVLVIETARRLSIAFASSRDAAARTREAAERRTALLAALGRMHQLEPEDVLGVVAEGLVEVGFDEVTTWMVDHRGGVARRLLDASPGSRVEATELPVTAQPLAEAVRTRRIALLLDGEQDGDGGRTVLLPFVDDEQVVAVVVARRSGELAVGELEAARSLYGQAGAALVRARSFARDQATVEGLQRLDLRSRDFVSTVSHELRTPLTVVQGLGQTMLDRWNEVPEEQRADLLRRIESNADRLAAMVGSLLDTSAIESGELELQRQVVELGALLAPVVERLAAMAERHPMHLEVEEELWVDADPRLLEHVVENLLTNVARHTPAGTRASVRGARVDGRIEVVVEDDGPGIAADELPHVFERFWRGGDPDRRPPGGLGLGLALADEIVRLHGGTLRIDSEEGRGSRFSFDVPVARPGSGSA
jgi:signal transduction histidine kinase